MSKASWLRQMKRKAMKEQGMTFKERMDEAIRLKMPVRKVEFNFKSGNLKVQKA